MEKTKQFWNKQAKKYDYNERQFDPVFNIIIPHSKTYLNANDIVLDFGCATGTKTLILADSVKHIKGLDISTDMIKDANQKKEQNKIDNVDFMCGTIYENPFKNESFNKIISYGVLHLLKDIDNVLEKIYDLLKPGGLFISSTACLQDKMAFKNRLEFSSYLFIKKLGIFPLHMNMFTTSDVENIVNSKFQIIEAQKIFHGISISFIVAKKL